MNPSAPCATKGLAQWVSHFVSTGSDSYTAERRAMAMLYRETVAQAQLLAYGDDFFLLAAMFAAVPLLLPLMRRIRMPGPAKPAAPVVERSPGVAAEPP